MTRLHLLIAISRARNAGFHQLAAALEKFLERCK